MKNAMYVLIAGLFLFVAFGCELFDTDSGNGYSKEIEYSVTGTADKVDITMSNKDDNTEQKDDVSVPWDYSFTKKDASYQFLYISAQNQGETGSVTVKIIIDGEVEESATSEGEYVIATADTSIGS